MAIFKDIQLAALDGDLKIYNGDFITAPSDNQNIYDILVSYPGFYHQFPNVGVGLPSYLDGDVNSPLMKSNITSQLKLDGFNVNGIKVAYNPSTGTMDVIPNASRNNS